MNVVECFARRLALLSSCTPRSGAALAPMKGVKRAEKVCFFLLKEFFLHNYCVFVFTFKHIVMSTINFSKNYLSQHSSLIIVFNPNTSQVRY